MSKHTRGAILAALMTFPALLNALAQPQEPVRVKVVTDSEVVVPGEPFHVGALFEIDPPWHIYWKNPGDAGLPTKFAMKLPEDFKADPFLWPPHKKFTQPGGIVGYGYESNVLFPAKIYPPADLEKEKDIQLDVEVSWLRCSPTLCVPGKATQAVTLPVGDESKPINRKLFTEEAPAFTLKDQGGKEVSLSDYKGKVVVLEWTNPDCPFVKRHYREGTMKSLAAKYGKQGVVWLAINSTFTSGVEKNSEWASEQKITYPLLDDHEGTVGKAYGAKTTPHMFVIDKEGKIAYRGGIDDDREGERGASARTNFVDQALAALTTAAPVAVADAPPYGCSVKYKS